MIAPILYFVKIYHMWPRTVLSMLLLAGGLSACSPQSPSSPAGSIPATTAGAGTPATGTPAAGMASATAELGARIYNGNCVPCHQQNGAGIPGVYPGMAGSPVVVGDPDALALWVIKGQRPASMPAGRYSTQMFQFGWLKPADAAALFSFLRSNFGNSAPPVDAAAVAKALGP
jgi:mono/diheme cytochrome c family protein